MASLKGGQAPGIATPLILKVFTVLFVDRRLLGRVIGIYYKFLRKFGIKVVNLKTRTGLEVACFSNSVSMFIEVFQKEDYSFDVLNWNNKTVIDIGANQGFFSLYAAEKGAKVNSFDPCEETIKIFRTNIAHNKLCHNVSVHDYAVTGKDTEVELFVGLNESDDILSGSVSIMNDNRGGVSVQRHKVKGMPINMLFLSLEVEECDVLKIDYEGAEYEIFNRNYPPPCHAFAGVIHPLNESR